MGNILDNITIVENKGVASELNSPKRIKTKSEDFKNISIIANSKVIENDKEEIPQSIEAKEEVNVPEIKEEIKPIYEEPKFVEEIKPVDEMKQVKDKPIINVINTPKQNSNNNYYAALISQQTDPGTVAAKFQEAYIYKCKLIGEEIENCNRIIKQLLENIKECDSTKKELTNRLEKLKGKLNDKKSELNIETMNSDPDMQDISRLSIDGIKNTISVIETAISQTEETINEIGEKEVNLEKQKNETELKKNKLETLKYETSKEGLDALVPARRVDQAKKEKMDIEARYQASLKTQTAAEQAAAEELKQYAQVLKTLETSDEELTKEQPSESVALNKFQEAENGYDAFAYAREETGYRRAA